MGVNNLGESEIGKLGTRFGDEGKGEVVGLETILFHLAKEKEGFMGMAMIDSFSNGGVTEPNGFEM